MINKEILRGIHQLGTMLKTPNEFKQAIKALLSHSPSADSRRAATRERDIMTFRELGPDPSRKAIKLLGLSEEQKKFVENRRKLSKHKSSYKIARKKAREELQEKYDQLIRQVTSYELVPVFTHYYKPDKHIGATTCLLISAKRSTVISKGVSLVSVLDMPTKLNGRYLSLGRALAAKERRETSLAVSREDADWVISWIDDNKQSAWKNKALYLPDNGLLTDIEIAKARSLSFTRLQRRLDGMKRSLSA
jgi:hypothetical protein